MINDTNQTGEGMTTKKQAELMWSQDLGDDDYIYCRFPSGGLVTLPADRLTPTGKKFFIEQVPAND